MDTNRITLVIADEHTFFRNGLRAALHAFKYIEVLSEASDGKQLYHAVGKHRPDVIITDISMPEMNGLEAMRLIKQRYPTTGIVVLSAHAEASIIKEVLQAGAHSYLLKTADIKEIEQAVQSAKRGKIFFPVSTIKHLGDVVQYLCQECTLSMREKEIIRLLFEELTTKEISEQLCLSERTVEEYRKHILEKTGSKNVVGIIKYALRRKIVELNIFGKEKFGRL
jgi:DNA-binding NarL/FixJ family response regulator